MRTVKTLISLITRVGGTQNIRNWMDELIKLEATKEQTMYTVNVSELHIDVQKELASHLNGKLNKGILAISQNPDNIAWEEVEISIYGSIDTDSDRLIEMISWGDEEEEIKQGDSPLLNEVKRNFTSLKDWDKYYCPGHKSPVVNGTPLESAVESLVNFLPRKYWGEFFTPTGRTKEVAIPSVMEGDGMRSNSSYLYDYDIRYEYQHADGTCIWAGANFTHVRSEAEILEYVQKSIYELFIREKMSSWDDFLASIEHQKILNQHDEEIKAQEAAKKAAEIPCPDWFVKIKKNPDKERFWVGDDYVISYFWNPEIGTVIEHMDDRRNGLNCPNRHKSVRLGTDEAVVVQQIESRLAERKAKMEIKWAYNEYVADRQQRKLPFKSFEKWMATK